MIQRTRVRDPLDTSAEIETPEHVRFRYQIAGPAKRALAYFIDLVIRGAVVFLVIILASIGGLAAGEAVAHASMGVVAVVWFLVEWTYYVFFDTLWSGRSPGRHVLSLRVVTENGNPLSFNDSALRNLLRAADFLPLFYAIGLVVMGRDTRFRRLGDLAAGTLVITEERHTVTSPLRLEPPPSQAELERLPQRLPLSGEELDAIELFLRRVGKLSVSRENELAEMVAPIFARRLGVKYRDATRFLGVLHYRAHEHRGQTPAEVAPVPSKRRKKVAA